MLTFSPTKVPGDEDIPVAVGAVEVLVEAAGFRFNIVRSLW